MKRVASKALAAVGLRRPAWQGIVVDVQAHELGTVDVYVTVNN